MPGSGLPQRLRRPVMRLTVREEPMPPRQPAPLRVGLLGGSFNPAHDGHRYVSLNALCSLGLDQVWWLVSPQNPLKPVAGMAPFAERLALARQVARHPRIRVSDMEARLGTRFTVDTLRRLKALRGHRFVWLLGADNLVQLPRWRRWREIMAAVPVAVFERAPYSYAALAGKAAACFGAARVEEEGLRDLVSASPPAWAFVRLRAHPASSTAIRRAAVEPAKGGDSEERT
jgi:nicotinate-nucleotide adenylyltransferase